jgi:hypothetical protein
MNNQQERVAKRKFTSEDPPVAMFKALNKMVVDQEEHEAKFKKKRKVATAEPMATTPCSDRLVRQMLQLIGIEAEFKPRNRETVANPQLVVLYFAIANYVEEYNKEHSEEEHITFYSPIESPTEELLQAVKAMDAVVFYDGLGLFDLKPNHSVSLYVENPEFTPNRP